MSSWLDLSNVSNTLKSTYVKGFVDVSGGDIITRNGNLLLAGDASLNSNLFVAGDLSLNQQLDVNGDVFMNGDVTILGNLKADKITNEYIINTETTNYALIVAEDLSLNGKLLVQADASFNEDLYVKGKLSIDGPINNISTTELNYLDGVTSAIQTQFDLKQNKEHLTEFIVTVAAKTANHPYYGSGSASGYVIDGFESPVLDFKSGNTYKFDQSDGSNIGWTLRFYLESDKTTIYTAGLSSNATAGSAGAYVQLIVDDNTPSKLFYRCADVNQDLMGHYIAVELASSGVNNTELGYLDGVTSAIQTQMDTKLASNASTFGGNATTVTNGVYTTSSVAVLSDVSDAGSGIIISAAERTKLSGIATSANNYSLPAATGSALGGIKVGTNVSITDGVLSATDTNTTYSVGDGGLTENDFTDTLKTKLDNMDIGANNYTLPTADTNTLGGFKVGTNLTMNGTVLSSANTTYSVEDGGLTQKNFTTTLNTKLDGIEDAADITDATNVLAAGAVMTSGDQTIGGAKTFSSTVAGSINGNAATATTAGTVTTAAQTAITSVGELTGLTIVGDLSLNQKLSVDGDASFNGDVHIVGNLKADKISNEYVINTETTNYTLIVAEDLSLNGKLLISEDASFNEDVYIKGGLSIDGSVPTWNQNTTGSAATVTGVAQTAITSVGTLSGLTVTAPIAGSVTGSAATVTGAAQTAITSVGTLASVTITGGTINATPIGADTASTGKFTTVNASGATTLDGAVTLGNAPGDAVTVTGTMTVNNTATFNGVLHQF